MTSSNGRSKYQIQLAKDEYGWVWIIFDRKGYRQKVGATNTRWGAIRQANRAMNYLDRKPEVLL